MQIFSRIAPSITEENILVWFWWVIPQLQLCLFNSINFAGSDGAHADFPTALRVLASDFIWPVRRTSNHIFESLLNGFRREILLGIRECFELLTNDKWMAAVRLLVGHTFRTWFLTSLNMCWNIPGLVMYVYSVHMAWMYECLWSCARTSNFETSWAKSPISQTFWAIYLIFPWI